MKDARKKVLQTIVQRRSLYAGGVFFVFMTTTQEILTPKFIQWSVDLISLQNSRVIPAFFRVGDLKSNLHFMGIFFFLTLMCGWVGRWGWRHTLGRGTHLAARDLRRDFWERIRHSDLRFFRTHTIGDLMNRITSDWNAARFIHGFTIVLSLDVVFVTGTAGIAMYLIDPMTTLVCFLCFPLFVWPIYSITTRQRAEYEKAQDQLSLLCDRLTQSLSTVRLQKATSTESMWIEHLGVDAKKYADLRFRAMKVAWSVFPMATFPAFVAYLVSIVFGMYRVREGAISVGELVALQSYVLLLQIPLFELGDCISEWQRGLAGLTRMLESVDQADRTRLDFSGKNDAESQVSHTDGALEVRDLCVDLYKDGALFTVFDHLNLLLMSGQRVGISGGIGKGKSTLLLAMAALIPVAKGQVLYFNRSLQSLGNTNIRKSIMLVPQRSYIFSGSLRENLSLEESFSDDELWFMLELVDLAKDIAKMEEGLDTIVGERGATLSGGQRQRLALARGLIRRRPILLLDDCLSAVDAETEEQILGQLDNFLRTTTVVWVAHRSSTLAMCDRRFILSEGKLT